MGKPRLVRFSITEEFHDNHSSIKQVFRAILSEIANKAVAKGVKFEFRGEMDDLGDTGSYSLLYEVGEDVNVEEQLGDIVSGLGGKGISVVVNPEDMSTHEEYVFGATH